MCSLAPRCLGGLIGLLCMPWSTALSVRCRISCLLPGSDPITPPSGVSYDPTLTSARLVPHCSPLAPAGKTTYCAGIPKDFNPTLPGFLASSIEKPADRFGAMNPLYRFPEEGCNR